MDICFILDGSGSIGSRVWDKRIKDFLKKFVNSQIIGPDNVQIGLSVFSDAALTETKFNLDTYSTKDPMLATMANLPYPTGQTCISCGLKQATDDCFIPSKGDRSDAKNVAILLTDGVSNRQVNQNELETQRLKDASGKMGSLIYTDTSLCLSLSLSLSDCLSVGPYSYNDRQIEQWIFFKDVFSTFFLSVCLPLSLSLSLSLCQKLP